MSLLSRLCSKGFSILLLTVSLSVFAETEELEIIGIECANDALKLIPLLGKAEDFPAFLLRDIEKELVRQEASSKLARIECTAPPEVLASTVPASDDPNEQRPDVLSQLRLKFYLDILVNAGNQSIPLTVEQVYLAENLEATNNRRLRQRFVVVKQSESEGEG